MSETSKPSVGEIAWVDLTVPDADGLCDFYQGAAGCPGADGSLHPGARRG